MTPPEKNRVPQALKSGSTNAPHAKYSYFNGIQQCDVSNNGTGDTDYVTTIANQTTAPGSGFFQNGATSGTSYADFDASYQPINANNIAQSAQSYTVQAGDTLQSIAQAV